MIHAGGVTSAKGFKAWGEHVGLKRFKKDMALIVSEQPCDAAAVFTTNQVKAAPVLWNQNVLNGGGKVQAVLVNSGQANSCTGAQGALNAALMAEKTAVCLGYAPAEIMLASTGLIGVQIKMEQALSGIEKIASLPRDDQFAGTTAAEAILTTDTCVKQCAITFEVGGKEVTIGAMAKGSGMIHPNMATMLGFLCTDVAIAPHLLQKALKQSTEITFNMISVDGDTSTNDMVILLANGLAGNEPIESEGPDFAAFCQALNAVNTYLSKKISCDVAGTTKKIAVTVHGSPTLDGARVLARKIVSSNLVKASVYKSEANWGRVVAASGSSGVAFDLSKMTITYASEKGSITAFQDGEQHPDFADAIAAEILSCNEVAIVIGINQGDQAATAWGCDMEYDPIRSGSKSSSSGSGAVAEFAEVG